MKSTSKLLPWFIWSLPLAFFAFQFILRLFPGLVMPELLAKYEIDATAYGLFAAMYYLGYAGMQLPVAISLDRLGPRLVITLSIIICSLASFLLVASNSWTLALISRFLIGAGSVVGFLGTSKIISLYFAKEQYTKMVGLTFTFGLLGALYGGQPTSHLIENFGWQNVTYVLAIISLLLASMIAIFVQQKPQSILTTSKTTLSQDFKLVLLNKPLMLLAGSNFLMVGTLEGFADVWGVPYFVESRGLEKTEAVGITTFIFVGMIFGGPLLAFLAEKFKAHLLVTLSSGILMAIIIACVLLFNNYFSHNLLCFSMFLVGLLCCYQVVVFSIGSNMVPTRLLSVTIALLNCINMLGGSFFHTIIGSLMDINWSGEMLNGSRYYNANCYSSTLLIIPALAFLGSLILLKLHFQEKAQSRRI